MVDCLIVMQVKTDIASSLGLVNPVVVLGSSVRKNLFYEVFYKDVLEQDGVQPIRHLIEFVSKRVHKYPATAGVIYTYGKAATTVHSVTGR